MSILIKGMDMPKTCYDCGFVQLCENCEGYENTCAITGESVGYEYSSPFYDTRRGDCPLIEIPPHGRLIDADEYEECLVAYAREYLEPVVKYGDVLEGMFEASEIARTMPTIIEAEEGAEE